MKKMKYFFDEDILYIPLSKEKSLIGDEDYQDNVVLYKHNKKVVGIEIHGFSSFQETLIKISSSETLNLAEPFKRIKMVISLRDIIIEDPQQFEENMKMWGFRKVESISKSIPEIGLSISEKEISNLSLASSC
jgi:uncharacterized protein YuzE